MVKASTHEEYLHRTRDVVIALEERVQRGVELLDIYGPADWRERIEPSRLQMADPQCCIVGQIYDGAYGAGCDVLLGETRHRGNPEDVGFDFDERTDETYPELRSAWIDALAV